MAYLREVPQRLTTTVRGTRLTMVHAHPWARDYDCRYAVLDTDDGHVSCSGTAEGWTGR